MKPECVLITGASSGIGRAAALAFAKNGYRLVINCRNSADRLLKLKGKIENKYQVPCMAYVGDAGCFETVKDMFTEVEKKFGGVDILVNNAGISFIGLLQDMSPEEWQQVIQTNLTSVFNCSRQAIPQMLKSHAGKIINISSVWGETGASCEAAYSAAKGGINAFTRALAKELAPSNIQVNAVACGAIDTPMNAGFSEEERTVLQQEIPAGRFGRPEEAAETILYLARANSYLTGQIIRLDGGWI